VSWFSVLDAESIPALHKQN